MDQRVFGPLPPENHQPIPLIVPTPCMPLRPKSRKRRRRLLIAVRRLTRNTPPENNP